MASMSWSSELNVPRRSRRSVSNENQPSTRLSHEELVGVKCRCHRSRLGCANHLATGGALWAERLSKHDVDVEVVRHVEVDQLEEGKDVLGGVVLLRVEEDLAGRDVEGSEEIGRPVTLVVMGLGPRRPGVMGRLGWVRSRAWTWVFSSKLKTTARSGGSR